MATKTDECADCAMIAQAAAEATSVRAALFFLSAASKSYRESSILAKVQLLSPRSSPGSCCMKTTK